MVPATMLVSAAATPLPLLFVDDAIIDHWDDALTLKVHSPIKGPRVISPTKEWESWAVFAYNHVMEVPAALRSARDPVRSSRYRLYYDCIEGTGLPPGRPPDQLSSTSARRICLGTSNDGLHWEKPELGIFDRNGTKGWSKANNILLEDSGVSVFLDRSSAAVASGRVWKMVCSQIRLITLTRFGALTGG